MTRRIRPAVAVSLLLLAAFIFLAWLAGRESTLQWLAQHVTAASDGRVQLEGVSGSVYGPIRAARIVVDSGGMRITAERLEVRWRLSRLWRPAITVTALTAGAIDIDPGSAPAPAQAASDSGPLPLSLHIESARIERLRLTAGAKQTLVLSKLELTGALTPRELRAEIRGNDGQLRANASLTLDAARAFQLSAEFTKLDLAGLGELPHTTINASLAAQGSLAPFSVSADWRVHDSRFNGEVLASQGRVRWMQEHIAQLDVSLRLADNQAHAAGAFGKPGEALNWRLSMPRLAKFGRGFSGSAQADGSLRGSIADPTLAFNLAADRVLLFGAHRVQQIRAHGRFGADAHDPFSAVAVAGGYRGPSLRLDRGEVQVRGTRAAHRIDLLAQNPALHLTAAARGAWAEGTWRGEILTLANRGSQAFALHAPAKLALGRDGIEVAQANFDVAGGQLRLAHLLQRAGELRTHGQASGIAMGRLREFLPAIQIPLSTSLIVDARWDLKMADTVEGELKVTRRQGDVVLGANPALALGLTEMAADARIERNRVHLALTAAGKELGRMQGQGQMLLVRQDGLWTLKRDAPFALSARAQLPSLAWLGKLSPTPMTVAGRLDLDLNAAGTLNAPQWRGTLQGAGLGLKLPDQGLDWRDGSLAGQLEGARFKLQRLTARAGEGSVQIEGWAGVDGGSGELALTANQALLTRTPTRQIIANGSGRMRLYERQLNIGGDIRVDRAQITLPKHEGATLSDDIVVVGRKQEEARHASPPFSTQIKVNIDFGERFYVKGHGVDARLAGAIELHAADTGLPVGRGNVRVAEGTYSAYGQRLQIDRGVLTFNGPIDNPALDILALRKEQEVQAGVAITGTALNPVVKLVSIPEVPDSEKLAWLVLGHGLNQASGKDFDLLNAAAASILARGESVSLQAQIAQRFGLDEFRVSGRGELEDTIVTLGKKLSSDVYVAYQRSVSGTTNVFTVKYKLTTRWSLQTQTGPIETAADLLYTLSFD